MQHPSQSFLFARPARRWLSVCVAALAFVAAAVAAAPPSEPEAATPATSNDDAASPVANGRPLLQRYCVDCHNEKKAKGKLNLAAVGHDPARPEFANAWRQGIGRLRQIEMPPEDAPQPT